MIDISNSLVFIVDDDAYINVMLSEMIERSNLNVRVKIFNDDSFLSDPEIKCADLLVIDIVLKGEKNGFELALESNKLKFCPVLFISGYDFEQFSRENKEVLDKIEVYDFVQKPLTISTFINRVKLLLSGMRYTDYVIKGKNSAENRFWSLLKCLTGIYCIFSEENGNVIYADFEFIQKIGLCCEEELHEKSINIHDLLIGFNPVKKDERQDFVSELRNLDGKPVSIGKWFTWYINSHDNLFLTVGIPMINDIESVESIYLFYKEIISRDKEILDLLRGRNHYFKS